MPMPKGFLFTQGKLQDYLDCQRRFELKYLLEQSWPAVEVEPAETYEASTLLGQRFHQMVHQYLLGIPAELITETIQDEEELKLWWKAFLDHIDVNGELNFILHQNNRNYPEISLSATILNRPIIAKYDLISVAKDNQITIVDWKTSANRPNKIWLSKRMQTRIYPYLLIKTGTFLTHGISINPDDVTIIFWFANHPDSPEMIYYSREEHISNEQYLEELIAKISKQHEGEYPLTSNKKHCLFCIYRSLCERGNQAGSLDEYFISSEPEDEILELGLDLDQIAEIQF